MSMDHILLIGFGGPPTPEDVAPFLSRVTQGRPIPPERLADVERHYHAIGGRSPYNECALRLLERLSSSLRAEGMTLPVFLGMRNWHPLLSETVAEISSRGLRHGLGIVLAPHRCEASFERYLRDVETAKREAAAEIRYDYLEPWHDHPLFIEAQAEQVRAILQALPAGVLAATHLLFTAHSIPVDMASRSRYAEDVQHSSRLVAASLGSDAWSAAYQSRSGPPREPWLEPDVRSQLRTLKAQGAQGVLFVPIGFLFDHVEVLYDLDVEAREEAERLGLRYRRASTVMDHPACVAMFTRLILTKVSGTSAASRSV